MNATHILPCKGRGTTRSAVEGCPRLDSATPLRRADARHLPLQGRID